VLQTISVTCRHTSKWIRGGCNFLYSRSVRRSHHYRKSQAPLGPVLHFHFQRNFIGKLIRSVMI